MTNRDSVYLSPMGKSSEKLAASGMCLGPKDPGNTMIRSITVSYAFTWLSEKTTNVKFRSPDVHWVRHHTHIASLAADIIRRWCVASPAANCVPCHQTSDQGHHSDSPDDSPRDSASIRVTLERRGGRSYPGRKSGVVDSRAWDIGSAACNFGRICDRADKYST